MLALTGLGPAGEARTLVFDEIDAGVGGNTARAVGERLRDLGEGRQVDLHHPPAAGRLARIDPLPGREGGRRRGDGGTVEAVAGDEQLAEIVRMLGADSDDEAASRHAKELLSR